MSGTEFPDLERSAEARKIIGEARDANRYWEGRWRDEKAENDRLTRENWQLKGALGYEVPGDIPPGPFKCGLCEARKIASTNINQ